MTFWHVYEDLSTYEQSVVSFDDICASSGVPPKTLLMAIAASGFDAGCDIANLVAAHVHPKVVDASIQAALKPDGIEDRKMLLQHHGFVPVPKGTSIVVNASSSAVAHAAAAAQSNPSVPSFLDDVDSTGDATKIVQGEIVKTQQALPPASETPLPWDGILDQVASKAKVG